VKYCLPGGFGCILSWSSFRGRGFCCPASPPLLPEAFNSTCPPGALSARYPAETISCEHEKCPARSSPAMSYGLCCFYCGPAYCRASYCVTDSVSRADRSSGRALACCSRVHPRAFAVVADDKIVESEVAPRVTPVAAARRSRPYPRAHPLLRIGDPSPYAPSPALPSVDPTVRRSYPLSFYKPKHDPEALVAIGTSLAGAQTTPPETSLSSPKRKKLQKPPISSTFTNIPSA
jgi:hypothetical protein